MGVIKNGILGGVAGKVAGVVGARWKNVQYLRGYAIPANPRSVAQTTQRSKFGFCVQFAKTILIPIINGYWELKSPNMSGYNSFMKANVANFDSVDGITNLIRVTEGNLEQITASSVTARATEVEINIAASSGGDGLATDKVGIVVYNQAKNISYIDTDISTRSGVNFTFTFPTQGIGTELYVAIFGYRGTGKNLYMSTSEAYIVTTIV